jgi:hypothetical protein
MANRKTVLWKPHVVVSETFLNRAIFINIYLLLLILMIAHAKGTSCLRAEFQVNDWLAHRFRHGIFQPGARYPAYVRTSNGFQFVQTDTESDVRGLAFKLMVQNST